MEKIDIMSQIFIFPIRSPRADAFETQILVKLKVNNTVQNLK